MASIDFEQAQDLIAQLGWLEVSLKGTSSQPGLIMAVSNLLSRLDAPAHPAGQSGEPNLLAALNALSVRCDHLIAHTRRNLALLEGDLPEGFSKRLSDEFVTASSKSVLNLRDELSTLHESFGLLVERLNENCGQAEIASRVAGEQLARMTSELRSSVSMLSEQIGRLTDEASASMRPEALREPLEELVRDVAVKVMAEAPAEEVKKAYVAELGKLKEDILEEVRQTNSGMLSIMMDGRKDHGKLVKQLLANRRPSETIVALYDELSHLKDQNESLVKRNAENQAKFEAMKPQSKAKKLPVFPLKVCLILSGAVMLASVPSMVLALWLLSKGLI